MNSSNLVTTSNDIIRSILGAAESLLLFLYKIEKTIPKLYSTKHDYIYKPTGKNGKTLCLNVYLEHG